MVEREFTTSLTSHRKEIPSPPKVINRKSEPAAKKAELAVKKEEARYAEFAAYCELKLLPIFKKIIKYYLVDQEFELEIKQEKINGCSTFLISLNWQASEELKNRTKFPFSIPNHVQIRVFLDAIVGQRAQIQQNAFVIAEASQVWTKQNSKNHLLPSFVRITTLRGKGSRGWQKKVEQAILKQLGVYEPLS